MLIITWGGIMSALAEAMTRAIQKRKSGEAEGATLYPTNTPKPETPPQDPKMFEKAKKILGYGEKSE